MKPVPLHMPDGTLEGLKWLALLLMTGDHINKYLFNGTLPLLFEVGRLALPLFVFVLTHKLARPGALERGAYTRTMKRLALFGALASVPFIALGGLPWGWLPINVMGTLWLLAACAYLASKGGWGSLGIAGLLFALGGLFVEFWWPAIAFGMAVWSYCKRPTWFAAIIAILACAALWFINGNFWALAALPLLCCATYVDLPVPRWRWVFYAFYPAHLAALWLIRIPMRKAGHLFFY